MQLHSQQSQANLEIRSRIVGKFDPDQIALCESEVGKFQNFTAAIHVVDHYPDDRTIDGIRDTQSDHLELMTFELRRSKSCKRPTRFSMKTQNCRKRATINRTSCSSQEAVTTSKTHRTQ